ncbi:MAG: tRNA lysidine(34) synthetase TilS [Rickettsiales bacterium]|jgi:tRNA(Ile)-lysidine synthase|nr:tRNA lysidine(34) synthetase TilS [Rickettsiales bacterium]
MNRNFISSIEKLARDYPKETFAAAISGGADSMALLYWMKETNLPVVALTVDHGLRKESAAEAAHVAATCKKIGVKHKILKWASKKPKTGIEAAARAKRYDLMTQFCKKNNIRVLITAHHADDQIETFFINLGRGSGVYGLAGMRERTERDGIVIFRPLLKTPRDALRKYCDDNKIKFFDDPMNGDDKFLRVKIRENRRALGLSDERLLLAVENLGRARDFLEAKADEWPKKIPVEIDAIMLLDMPDELRFRILSKILSKGAYPPRLDGVKKAFEKLDAGDCGFTLANCNIRRRKNKIRIWEECRKK